MLHFRNYNTRTHYIYRQHSLFRCNKINKEPGFTTKPCKGSKPTQCNKTFFTAQNCDILFKNLSSANKLFVLTNNACPNTFSFERNLGKYRYTFRGLS